MKAVKLNYELRKALEKAKDADAQVTIAGALEQYEIVYVDYCHEHQMIHISIV